MKICMCLRLEASTAAAPAAPAAAARPWRASFQNVRRHEDIFLLDEETEASVNLRQRSVRPIKLIFR